MYGVCYEVGLDFIEIGFLIVFFVVICGEFEFDGVCFDDLCVVWFGFVWFGVFFDFVLIEDMLSLSMWGCYILYLVVE